jgi:hypothetical protein
MTRTVGMPGAMDDIGNWLEPVGLVSIVVEAFVIWNSLRAAQEITAERNNQHRLTRNTVKDLADSRA